jgi:hypothetical protein
MSDKTKIWIVSVIMGATLLLLLIAQLSGNGQSGSGGCQSAMSCANSGANSGPDYHPVDQPEDHPADPVP